LLTYSHPKVVEGVHVDLLDLVEQLEGVVGHGGHVAEVDPVAGVGRESGCRHVSGARALDFLDAAAAWKEKGRWWPIMAQPAKWLKPFRTQPLSPGIPALHEGNPIWTVFHGTVLYCQYSGIGKC